MGPGSGIGAAVHVGGFDARSRFSWNVLGANSFTFGVRNGLHLRAVGVPALSVGCETGLNRYEYDVVQHGPVVGLTWVSDAPVSAPTRGQKASRHLVCFRRRSPV
jgi:hypothetical protein